MLLVLKMKYVFLFLHQSKTSVIELFMNVVAYSRYRCVFSLVISGDSICVSSDTKEAYEKDGCSGKSFTAVVGCGNAAGTVLPPYTIYAAKNVKASWCDNGPDRAQYQSSKSGWITEQLFIDWFENCFLVETLSVPRQILLLMDSLPAHISIRAIELTPNNQVILPCLPPKTTHSLQPLDVSTLGFVFTNRHNFFHERFALSIPSEEITYFNITGLHC